MKQRVERDSLGERLIPSKAYYGCQTLRAADNFPITGDRVHPQLIQAVAMVKKAAFLVNMELGMLEEKKGNALVSAAEEIMEGQLHDEFIVDPIQGGAGTSINMNMNEVLANRALEIIGSEKGNYKLIHPNNHANMGQSTNDVLPTAVRLGAINLLDRVISRYGEMVKVLEEKAQEFDDVIKMGRTHLQDAVPIRLGQEFQSFADAAKRDLQRFAEAQKGLRIVNLGATAIGTGLNADREYVRKVTIKLSEIAGQDLKQAANLVDATQNHDQLAELSGALRTASLNLNKVASDLRLMASGPRAGLFEITIPPAQPGSSIMPGKVNPVIPEVVSQVAFQIQGNDLAVSMAVQSGQLDLNAMMPILVFNLYQSLDIIAQAATVFSRKCLQGIEANKERCRRMVEESLGIITAINPHVGYEAATRIVQKSLATGKTLREIVLEEGLLTAEELDIILNPQEMTRPGIAGKELLEGYGGVYEGKGKK